MRAPFVSSLTVKEIDNLATERHSVVTVPLLRLVKYLPQA
jgi:hypothetical protein